MANVNFVRGFKYIGNLSSAGVNAKPRKYFVPATDETAIFVGDAVKLGGSADASGKVASAAQLAATEFACGIVVAVDPIMGKTPGNENLNLRYRLADTAAYIYVIDDSDALFEIQADAALVAADVGLNASIVVAAGNTLSGLSGMMLDVGTIHTNVLELQILGLTDAIDNELGTYNKAIVRINKHQYNSVGTTGI